MELKNKITLVTGGGTGIGRAIAEGFAAAGAEVLIVGRRKQPLEETADSIRQAGGSAHVFPCDITSDDEVAALFKVISERWGRLDLLYNNAGSFQTIGPLWEVSPQDWWTDATINLKGCMLTMHHALRMMVPRDEGLIINMNGGGATVPLPGGSGYGSSKAALLRLTETVAKELERVGSKVMVVAMGPGLVRTEMTALQVDTEVGREWIPSTQGAFESDRDLTPDRCVTSILELLEHLDPVFNGRIFSKGMDFAKTRDRLKAEPDAEAWLMRMAS